VTADDRRVVRRDVPVRVIRGQSNGASLHVLDIPRDLPSTVVRVFLDNPDAGPDTPREHPSFAGDLYVYNSPAPGRAVRAFTAGLPDPDEPGPYDASVDISAALARIAPGRPRVSVTLVVDRGPFTVGRLSITTSG
jgi:hypothetical protein